MSERTLPLESDPQRYTLGQVAERLDALARSLEPGSLARELLVAALCCSRGQTHLEDTREFLERYQVERLRLDTWFDDQVEQLSRACLGGTDELERLRPDAQGAYAWDRWQAQALAAGLGEELATLGRALMREAVQHDWEEHLKAECGWRDGGRALLGLALRDGEAAAERWTWLLETDGERGRWTEDGDWVPL